MVATSDPVRPSVWCRFGLHNFKILGYGGAGWHAVECVRCGVQDIL